MSNQVTNYQCPACTGPLHFVGESGMLECDYCASRFSVDEIENYYKEKDAEASENFEEVPAADFEETQWDESGLNQKWDTDETKMRSYTCPSCAAELVCDEHTAATRCPYCGNPTVIPGQFKNEMKPDYVIPFKLSQDDAVNALKKYYKGKKFLPKEFSSQNQIKEIQGVYVPCWMFNGVAHANITFEATRSMSHRQGDYRVTNTDHFDVHRVGLVPFENIPVDASKRMPDSHMDAIEPFDYSELKTFSNAYLPGYLAEKYSVPLDSCKDRADQRVCNTAVDCMRKDVTGYEACMEKHRNVQLERGKVNYALLPVYLLSTKYKGKDYLFAMNGQTGKLIGDLPVDSGKYWLTFGSIFAAVTAVVGTILMFM